MKQLLLALLLLGAVTLLVPDLRERAAPHAQSAREWGWEHARGPLAPVLNPFRRIQAKTQMGEIGRRLVNDRNRGQRRPDPEEFTAYIMQHRLLADTLDPWGTVYRMTIEGDSVAIGSAGPDRIHGTEDDEIFRIRYPWRDPPRRPGFR